jgi:hypothetical protein
MGFRARAVLALQERAVVTPAGRGDTQLPLPNVCIGPPKLQNYVARFGRDK